MNIDEYRKLQDQQEYQYLYQEILNMVDAQFLADYKSDTDPGKNIQTQIVERDEKYTDLLTTYLEVTEWRLRTKEIYKLFFLLCVGAACNSGLKVCYQVVNRLLAEKDIQVVLDGIPALLAALTAFVATVIVVPHTIAQFLFDTKEDDNITAIIKHTQKHDSSTINLFKAQFTQEDSIAKTQKPPQNICGDGFESVSEDEF